MKKHNRKRSNKTGNGKLIEFFGGLRHEPIVLSPTKMFKAGEKIALYGIQIRVQNKKWISLPTEKRAAQASRSLDLANRFIFPLPGR